MSDNVVIDTNVIVSALYSPKGKPAEVLDLFFAGKIKLFFSDGILAEYEDVLSRSASRSCIHRLEDAVSTAVFVPYCVARRLHTTAGMRPPRALSGAKTARRSSIFTYEHSF